MLSSIHPLGERARHNRWGLTVAAHAAGSWLGAAAVFGAAGLVGALADVPAWFAVPAAVAAVVLDVRALLRGARIPGPRRQVNEDWLNRYRGWVYGAGFGMQLGAAVLTIVTSAAVYLALVLTVLAGSKWWWAGVVVGSVYGVVRTLPLLGARRVQQTDDLAAVHRRLRRRARPVHVASTVALAALAGVLTVGAAV